MKKRTYRTMLVQNVDVQALSQQLGDAQKCVVAIDIAKEAMVAGFCTDKGACVSLVRFSRPTQTIVFLRLLEAIRDKNHAIKVAMEPTGVYGDALRYQLVRCGFEVFRVDAVRARAIAAVLDGVPSSHGGKEKQTGAFNRSLQHLGAKILAERCKGVCDDRREDCLPPREQIYGGDGRRANH